MSPKEDARASLQRSMRVGLTTDRGLIREGNEDCLCALVAPYDRLPAGISAVLIVADGMGGAEAGEVASRYTVQGLREFFSVENLPDVGYSPENDDYFAVVLKEALEQVNGRVYSMAVEQPELYGMGTTATVALLASDKVFVGHVGDSRAYRVQNGELTCLTVDHTWVQGEVEAGRMTAEQAAIHPRRNVLTRALGTGPFVRVDRTLYSIDVGDMLILCTDGLLKVVSEAEMLIYARNVWDPQEVCDTLVSLSNYRGGPDNISVIVARVTAEAEQLKIEADTQIITPVKQDPTPRKPNSSILSKFRLRG